MERTSHFADIDGPVHYVDYGGSGPAIVMLHGLGASHLNWDLMGPELASSYRPFAPDLRGFGMTPLDGHRATLDAQVELAAGFISAIAGGEAIVFGNSMGGTVAMLLAAAHPELVTGLVLLAPGVPPQSPRSLTANNLRFFAAPLLPGLGEAALRHYAESAPPEERTEFLIEAMTAQPGRIGAATRAGIVEMRRLRDTMEWAPAAYCQALRSTGALVGRRGRFRDMVHRIAAPTLLIHGMLDDTVRFEGAEWLAAERPDWTFSPLPDCGHIPHMELPARSLEAFREWAAGRPEMESTSPSSAGTAGSPRRR